MTLASKHLDIVMGIDIHIIQPPGPVPPLPIPHPFIGIIFDSQDYNIPPLTPGALAMYLATQTATQAISEVEAVSNAMKYLGDLKKAAKGAMGMNPQTPSTVKINYLPRTKAGTRGKAIPKHFPIGGAFVFVPLVISECEAFMGSSTVLVDNEPFAYAFLPVFSCSDVGMPVPPRKGKPTAIGMFLPTSVVMPIPLGPPVMVGGPPVPSMSAIVRNLMGAGLRMLKRSKAMKKASQRLHNAAGKAMDKLRIKNKGIRNAVHRKICSVTGHPVDIATGKVFTEAIDFELPGPIPLKWERVWYSTSILQGALGHGWHHNYDIALTYDPKEPEIIGVRMADGRAVLFPILEVGETHFDPKERLFLGRDELGYYMRDAERLTYRFSAQMIKAPELHLLETIHDDNGFSIDFKYDAQGNLINIIDSTNRVLDLQINSTGQITAIRAPHPNKANVSFPIVQYSYDDQGDLVEVLDALEQPFRYQYEHHLLIKETNRNGLSFYFEYDGTNEDARCLRTWGDRVAEWGETGIYDHKLTYFPDEKKTIVENSLGYQTTHYYNDLGVVHKKIDAKGNVTQKQYSVNAALMAEINELGESTQYTYDEWGNQTAIIAPDGATTTLVYEDNLLVAAVDSAGGKWHWEYDEKGNLIKRTDCLKQETTYAYESGLLRMITDSDENNTFLQYDEQYNLNQIITPDNQASFWKYDYLGRITTATDPKGNTQKRTIDLLGRVTQVQEPDGNTRLLEYDAEGNVIYAKDKQHEVQFKYKGFNTLAARAEAGTRVNFMYDSEEQLIAIKNEHGSIYRFELDANGDVTTEIGFDGVTRHYNRDAAGQVLEVERASGIQTQYVYDLSGRVIKVLHSDGARESYEYRADGELLSAQNDDLTVSFERDLLGRVLTENQGGYTVQSEYDKLGFRTGVQSSLGANFIFERDKMGDVEKVVAEGFGTPWEAHFQRDVMGLEVERLLPGNVRSRWVRDRLGRPVKHETSTAGAPSRVRTYKWDFNDRLKEITDSAKGTTRFEHDVFGNLAAAQYADGAIEYRMPDEVGNLFRHKDQKDRKYGPAGQLLEAEGTRYDYDTEGNLIKKTESNGKVWQYEWNAAGMLERVTRPDKNTVTFHYDALGRRIAKTYLGKTTRWVWDVNIPLHEWIIPAEDFHRPVEQRLSPETIYDEQPVAERIAPALTDEPRPANLTTWVFEPDTFSPLAKLQGAAHYSVVTDHLGTPVTMLNAQGESVWSAETSIYGQLRDLHGDAQAMPFRYPGQYEDVETGLYYNRFRYYDAEGGFYVSQDPIRLESSMSFYSYVHDTNSWVDIFGLARRPKKKNQLPDGRDGNLGPRNGVLEKRNPQTRELQQRRYYDAEGKPSKDIDYGHDDGYGDPHAHDWIKPSPQAPNKKRNPGRPLTEEEKQNESSCGKK